MTFDFTQIIRIILYIYTYNTSNIHIRIFFFYVFRSLLCFGSPEKNIFEFDCAVPTLTICHRNTSYGLPIVKLFANILFCLHDRRPSTQPETVRFLLPQYYCLHTRNNINIYLYIYRSVLYIYYILTSNTDERTNTTDIHVHLYIHILICV